ncbi:MAG: hypothetical protein AAF654_15185 [Myxococcota bacterium]
MWAKVKDWWLGPEQTRSLRGHLEALSEPRFSEHRCAVQAGLTRIHIERRDDTFTVRLPRDFEMDPYLGNANRVPEQFLGDGYFSILDGAEWIWMREGFDAAANEVERLLHTRLGFERNTYYSVALECATERKNEDLRTSMKKLARDRSTDSRRILYQELLSSFVLLAVEEADSRIEPYADPDELGGRPVWHIFTHEAALAEHPHASGAVPLSGVRLFQSALAHRIGALRIDFASPVGGELYGHELKRVAQAFPAALPPST